MSPIRLGLFGTAAVILFAGPALAQQAKPAAQGGQRAASAGVARSQFMANVTAEFAQIDTNKDGKASKDEIEKQRVAVVAKQRAANNTAAFNQLDTNKDGMLSKQEFAAPLANAPKINVEPLVKKLDSNNDGSVTQAEFVAGAAADFTRLDTNKDNVLTPQELRAGSQRR